MRLMTFRWKFKYFSSSRQVRYVGRKSWRQFGAWPTWQTALDELKQLISGLECRVFAFRKWAYSFGSVNLLFIDIFVKATHVVWWLQLGLQLEIQLKAKNCTRYNCKWELDGEDQTHMESNQAVACYSRCCCFEKRLSRFTRRCFTRLTQL